LATAVLEHLQNCSETENLKMKLLEFQTSKFNLHLLAVLYEALSLDMFQIQWLTDVDHPDSEPLNLAVIQALWKGPIKKRSKQLKTLGTCDLCVTPSPTKVFLCSKAGKSDVGLIE
jgi:hypothetical protein